MAAVKKLNVKIGDIVQIDGRHYDVVSDRLGGVALEPAITTTVADLHAEHGGRPLSAHELEDVFATLRSDNEG